MNEILAYLSDQRGKQFDPVLTDLFLDHLDQFMEIRNKYKFDP